MLYYYGVNIVQIPLQKGRIIIFNNTVRHSTSWNSTPRHPRWTEIAKSTRSRRVLTPIISMALLLDECNNGMSRIRMNHISTVISIILMKVNEYAGITNNIRLMDTDVLKLVQKSIRWTIKCTVLFLFLFSHALIIFITVKMGSVVNNTILFGSLACPIQYTDVPWLAWREFFHAPMQFLTSWGAAEHFTG